MFITYVVITMVMSVVLVVSAGAKFTRPPRMVQQMSTLELSFTLLPFLGVAQIAGAGGLIIGVWWGPLGIAAAICLTLYFIGAVAAHVRVGDIKGAPPAAALAIVAAVLIGLRVGAL
ncbi:DoxX family protein [Nocardia abscessus]|uniref:DoxX family protein n=1 Tax=Nocardia abscessus TaxID=120957 RepID=UPI0018937FAD|nr:DoxX family protein [Nocardia abscessus]MBF6341666.1 DoxX family protein [Nocardia abscessus]